jgi:uncharacterized membrane protein YvbJ
MGIVSCNACGNNVSQSAVSCPHCGQPKPWQSGMEKLFDSYADDYKKMLGPSVERAWYEKHKNTT